MISSSSSSSWPSPSMRSTWARLSGTGGLMPWVRATSSVERSGPVSPGWGWAIGLKKPTFRPARSKVRTRPRLIEVRPTPKSVGAMKNVCMRASRNKRCKKLTVKGSAIGPLCAPAASERLADVLRTLCRVKHPGACLPRRLVAQVLGMAARKFHHPVAFFVLMKAVDPTDGPLLVCTTFAIGRWQGYTCPLYILLQKVLPHADRRQQGCLHRLYPDQRRRGDHRQLRRWRAAGLPARCRQHHPGPGKSPGRQAGW
ncbi:hypothetical protein METHP14_650006 [Pseudomonas sp. P14-2025]